MKILVFSDVHRDLNACATLVDASAGVDFVIGAGDFCNMHAGLDEAIQALSAITRPSVVVPGNNETEDELRQAVRAWPAAIVLHAGGQEVEGMMVYGIGGGIPITPFGAWSYDFSDEDARAMLADCPDGCILVSHSPPKGHGDAVAGGAHVGSEAVLETIESRKPRLVVCGHVHDSWGYDEQVGATRIINAGPGGVIVEL